MHANNNIYLWGVVESTRLSWKRRDGLTAILGGTWSLRPARVGTRPARRSKEMELNLVVVAGIETGRPGSLLVLKKSVVAVECK
jgi:hypothetical protein